jgi:hypothetical protein
LPDNAYISFKGMGINSLSNHLYSSLTFTGFGSDPVSSVAAFDNCTEGINTEETSTHVTNSLMTNMTSGVTAAFNIILPITISNNNIISAFTGIDLQSNDGLSQIFISNNNITINDVYNDTAVCALLGYFRKKNNVIVSSTTSIKVIPNPAKNNVNFLYKLPSDKHGRIELNDLTGRTVFSIDLSLNSTERYVNISSLFSRLYLYYLIVDGEEHAHGKLSIIQ